jgi:hypothetical protein
MFWNRKPASWPEVRLGPTFPVIPVKECPLLERLRRHLCSASVTMGKKRKAIHDDFEEVEGLANALE